jgi:hypothetical protein
MKNPLPIVVSSIVAIVAYGGFMSLLAQSSVQAATSNVKLYVTPSTSGVTVGQTTALQLRLLKDSSSDVDYIDAKVTFSAANLEVVSISKQGSQFNDNGGPSTTYNNTNGTLSVTGGGQQLDRRADVLVATVTFKGKVAGSGSVSYTAASGAGEMTSGGNLKNILTTRVGGTVNVSNPISGGSTPGTPPPSPAPQTAPAATTPANTTPPAQDQPTTGADTSATPDNSKPQETSVEKTPETVGGTIAQTVAKPPVWLQYMVPAAAVVAVGGMAALGAVLYRKRRATGVTLPPAQQNDLGIPMPTTEAAAEQGTNEVPQVGSTVAPTDFANPDHDLPEFSAQQELDYTAPLAALAPVAPEVMSPVASVEAIAPQQAPAPPQEPLSSVIQQSPVTAPELAPLPLEQFAQPAVVAQPTAPVSLPVQTATTPGMEDYKNMPDMFDLGEQRLQAEGHAPLKPIQQ